MGRFAAAALVLAACAEDPSGDPPAADKRWPCPAEWVEVERGGCAPAVLACASEGGAEPGACTALDLTAPRSVVDPDGVERTAFWIRDDGSIGGGWPDPAFVPAAGIDRCPVGWMRGGDGHCDPALSSTCAAGAEPLPGGDCTATGADDCPPGDWPDVSAEAGSDRVVHVRAGASSGDGSAGAPFASIAEGIAAAGAGGWVLVGDGEYVESISARGPLHVVGRCAARVALRAPPVTAAILAGAGADLDVRGLSALASPGRGARAEGGARLRLERVRIEEATGIGVIAAGAGTRLEAADLVVVRTLSLAAAAPGRAIVAERGASIDATRVSLALDRDAAVRAQDAGTTITLRSARIGDTEMAFPGVLARGLEALDGATLDASEVSVASIQGVGIRATAAARVVLADVVVAAPRSDPEAIGGVAVYADHGGVVEADRFASIDATGAAVITFDADTRVVLRDSLLRGTRARSDGYDGRAVDVEGGTVSATRVRIEDNVEMGAWATGPESVLELDSCIVRGTLPRADEMTGHGVLVDLGARTSVRHSLLEANHHIAAVAYDPGTLLEIADSVVRDTRLAGLHGWGLHATREAAVHVERTAFATHREIGIRASLGATIALDEVAVLGTLAGPAGTFGRGLEVADGATVEARRLLIDSSVEVGLMVFSARSGVTASDAIVRGVSPSTRGFGLGLAAFGGASVDGERLAIAEVAGSAIAATPFLLTGVTGSRVTASDVYVRGVRSGTVQFEREEKTVRPIGRAVAYGLHAGDGCTVETGRVVIDEGGYGVFAGGGSVTVRVGVIARQVDAASAVRGVPGALVLEDVARVENARDTAPGDDLPAVAALAEPTAVCPPTECF